MKTDEEWMAYALSLARKAGDAGEVPVGAVVVSDDEVIGEGWNQPISSHDPSAHAEIVALRNAAQKIENYRLVDTTLYVTIEPCTMCFGAMIHARVKRLVFGAPEPKAGVICSNKHLLESEIYNHSLESIGGVREAECSALMQSFFAERRKQKKAPKEP